MFLKIRTRNYSADGLRNVVNTNNRAVLRLGSTTPTEEIFPSGVKDGKKIIEINSAESCANSADKRKMKVCFDEFHVKTAEWMEMKYEKEGYPEWMEKWSKFPAIIKHKNSSKGNGIFYIESEDEFVKFVQTNMHNLQNYIIEKYYNYVKEYRLHVTIDGCFYTCRKMLKEDAEERWHRHDVNSVWIVEENALFEKPKNWDDIVSECVKAMRSVGLDICSVDIKVQSEKGRKNDHIPEFIILEVNSASSMGEITLVKYIEQLNKMLNGTRGEL